MLDGCGGIFDSARDEFERMYDAFPFSECWLVEVLVHELDGVREQESVGSAVKDVEAVVVLECRSDFEPFAAAEVPSFADVPLGANYDGASNWS